MSKKWIFETLPEAMKCEDNRNKELFEKIEKIAKRLNVAPFSGAENFEILFCHEGVKYSLFDIMNAVLDRMEKATK